MTWEKIEESPQLQFVQTDRLKVHGGWIVRIIYFRGSYEDGCALHCIFIEDRGHEWELK